MSPHSLDTARVSGMHMNSAEQRCSGGGQQCSVQHARGRTLPMKGGGRTVTVGGQYEKEVGEEAPSSPMAVDTMEGLKERRGVSRRGRL